MLAVVENFSLNECVKQPTIDPSLAHVKLRFCVRTYLQLTISIEFLSNPQTMCSPSQRKHSDDPHWYGDIWLFWRDLQHVICVLYIQIVATLVVREEVYRWARHSSMNLSYSMDFLPSNFLVVVQVAEFVLINSAKKEHCVDKECRNICSFQVVRGPRCKTLILLFSNRII